MDKGLHFVGRFVQKQGPYRAPHLQMTMEHVGRCLEIYRLTLLVHVVDVVEEARRSSPATDDDMLEFGHFMQQVVFYFSETFLAMRIKKLLDGLVHTTLDIPVKVVKRHACLA